MPEVLTPALLDRIRLAAQGQSKDVIELAQRICAVPAPTGSEQQRADFVVTLLRERGYTPVIDAIGNVYVRRGEQHEKPVLMLLAHIDTVFPIQTPISIRQEDGRVYGPGIGDNSLSVATMITLLELLDRLDWQTETAILAVANVGEEGLGNLRGARAAIERHRSEIGAVIAIDGQQGSLVHAAVGSFRWRITVNGPGGHSFGSFGMPNAIYGLARIMVAIAEVKVPEEPKTTFNIGIIEGGTSVNTIAASASALLDLRSTDMGMLEQLVEQMRHIILHLPGPGVGLKVEITELGMRPAGRREREDPLIQLAARALKWIDVEPQYVAASTDANIPISLGIPAVCTGVTYGDKAHTLDEYIEIAPVEKGLAYLLRLCIEASALAGQLT